MLFLVALDSRFLQADLSTIATFFRNAQSGLVHLAAVKQEFQLEIKPLPILSKTVCACFFCLGFDFVVLPFESNFSFLP